MSEQDDLDYQGEPGEQPPFTQGEVLRVVRGDPTEDELAAVVGVLAALAAHQPVAGVEEPALGTSLWSSRTRALRMPPTHGPTAWRTQSWFRLLRR